MELINYEDKAMLETLRSTVAKGTNDHEFRLFVETCRASGLNPIKKQIWCFVSIDNKGERHLAIFAGLMGFLEIANSYPEFDGISEPESTLDEKGMPVISKVLVYRKDRKHPSVGKAIFKEDARRYKDGNLYKMWAERPILMNEKVATGRGIRMAFPQRLSNVYIPEEFGDLDPHAQPQTPPAAPVYPPGTEPETPPKPEPTEYSVPDITHVQRLFFEKRGCVYNTETGVWACPMNLGPRLEDYRVKPKQALDAPPVEIDIPFDLKPADEIPQETPLEKAKKRAAKMTAEAA